MNYNKQSSKTHWEIKISEEICNSILLQKAGLKNRPRPDRYQATQGKAQKTQSVVSEWLLAAFGIEGVIGRYAL